MKMPKGEDGQWALVATVTHGLVVAERWETVWAAHGGSLAIDFGQNVGAVRVFESQEAMAEEVILAGGAGDEAGVYAEVEAARSGIPEAAARALDSAGALCSDIIQGLEMVRGDGAFPHAVSILRVVLLRVAAVAVARVEVLDRMAAGESLGDAAKAVEGSLL